MNYKLAVSRNIYRDADFQRTGSLRKVKINSQYAFKDNNRKDLKIY